MITFHEAAIVGIAGTICGLAVRELPAIVMEKVFMRTPKSKAVNGNGLNPTTRRDVKDVYEETLEIHVLPPLREHTKLLEQIAASNQAIKDGILKLVERTPRRRT